MNSVINFTNESGSPHATPHITPAVSARDPFPCDDIVGHSSAFRDLLVRIERVAPTDATVLVTGETGTGKERVARELHRLSRRASHALVAVNLAATPEPLVASELFGHEHGAFTGAVQRRIGRFETANRGTLFLDEVGELSPEVQIALLRVLQDGEFERLGGSQARRADVRLIAATNCDLEQAVEQGQFREDLYYRLSVFPIHLPPLRERPEDVAALAEYFLQHLEKRLGKTFSGIDADSMERLVRFRWPGNIRQLQNVLEHAAILCDEAVLRIRPELLDDRRQGRPRVSELDKQLQENERSLIDDALAAAEGRVSGQLGAAARLGLPPSTLESKIRRFHIDKLRHRTQA